MSAPDQGREPLSERLRQLMKVLQVQHWTEVGDLLSDIRETEAVAAEHNKAAHKIYQIKTLLDRWNHEVVVLIGHNPEPDSTQGVLLKRVSTMVEELEKILFSDFFGDPFDEQEVGGKESGAPLCGDDGC